MVLKKESSSGWGSKHGLSGVFLLFQCILPRIAGQVIGMDHFPAHEFERRVSQTMDVLKDMLDETRNVQLAEYEDHTYADKFALVEFATRAAWQSLAGDWKMLGLDLSDDRAKLGTVLFLKASTKSDFLEEREVDVVGDGTQYSERGVLSGEIRSIRRVKEYVWNVTHAYRFYACLGTSSSLACEEENLVDIRQRAMSATKINSVKDIPPVSNWSMSESFNMTWWTSRVSGTSGEVAKLFEIDRSAASCKTPRRNEDVEAVLEFHQRLHLWFNKVSSMKAHLFAGKDTHQMPAHPEPVVPLMENSTLLSHDVIVAFLERKQHVLQDRLNTISEEMPAPSPSEMVSSEDGSLFLLVAQMQSLLEHHTFSVNYIENMLEKQLVQAVGKHLKPRDFEEYMQFHTKKLFTEDYAPRPFSHAIRRPNEYPVGIISIEKHSGLQYDPVHTITRHIPATWGDGDEDAAAAPIRIPIDAATSVEITGDRFLSAWIRYEFQCDQGRSEPTRLAARARQFSSFMVLVGTMTGPDSFSPKNAIILQNKDDVMIPLLTEVLPSATEFKDAIASLSPEQQEFARAYRAMQLESSVFAVVVIQLKPQLEKLLGLPMGALAKEIRLTEDLMVLFIDYQIPSDLLSYDGPQDDTAANKVNIVKQYVKSVIDVIDGTKKEQLEEEQKRAKAREARFTTNSVPFSPPNAAPSGSPSAAPSLASMAYASADAHTASQKRSLRGSLEEEMAPLKLSPEPEAQNERQETQKQDASISSTTTGDDFTMIPRLLDAKLEVHDIDGYLRSTIIKAGPIWTRKRQENLLMEPSTLTLRSTEIAAERKKAIDLLDAISRSGTLPIASSELHVVVGMTHCFTDSLMSTIIKDNINPIVKAEKSTLMVASTIHGETSSERLIGDGTELQRLSASFPALFGLPDKDETDTTAEDGKETSGTAGAPPSDGK